MRAALERYPSPAARVGLLSVVLLVNVAQYYAVYVHGSVSTILIDEFDMSLTFFVSISIAGSVLGGVASLLAGLGDRFGRVKLMLGGLLLESVLVGFVIPLADTKAELLVWSVLASAVEGIVLVLTPALVRDFSPRLSRGTAMGVWALGPVLGNLAASSVASRTLEAHPTWQFSFHVCGIFGLVVLVIAAATLRELPPELRNQVIGRERGAPALPQPLSQPQPQREAQSLLSPKVFVPAIGFGLYLFFYTTRSSFFVIYFVTTFAYTAARANSLDNWSWSATAVAVVVGGIVGDRVGARKPVMLVGLGIVVTCTAVWAVLAGQEGTTYAQFAALLVVLAVGGGLVTPNFMASYSEALEERNPALVATGMAIWGWMIRFGVAIAVTGVVWLVPAASTLVDHGPETKRIATQYGAELATLQAIDPATRAGLAQGDPAAQQAAVAEIVEATGATPADAVAALKETAAIPRSDLAYLSAHAADVKQAVAASPSQWQRWWWLCLLGELCLLPALWMLPGSWRRPRRTDPEPTAELVTA
jgi:MFS family permease